MIAPEAGLSVSRQCTLLGIARSSFYYRQRAGICGGTGPAGKEPPAGAGTAERGHRHLGITGAERIAEGQREEYAERRTARGLRVEQAGEEGQPPE